jgi:hypothetical protein
LGFLIVVIVVLVLVAMITAIRISGSMLVHILMVV